jgi:hypothetical protein
VQIFNTLYDCGAASCTLRCSRAGTLRCNTVTLSGAPIHPPTIFHTKGPSAGKQPPSAFPLGILRYSDCGYCTRSWVYVLLSQSG